MANIIESKPRLSTTEYYAEFLRYYQLAAIQQKECNLGTIPHAESSVADDLMRQVHLYDVVERKYAGFTQILLDMWHGADRSHPYHHKLPSAHGFRKQVTADFHGSHNHLGRREWWFIFMVHRLTGSGINYAKSPSGYHNTVLPHLRGLKTIKEMVKVIRHNKAPMYTSVGYQFPSFPKPPVGEYKRGGDYFICEYLPELVKDLDNWFKAKKSPRKLREVGDWLFNWNQTRGLRAYRFQYAAFIADIADFYPELVDTASEFYYGTNAVQCLSYFLLGGRRRSEKDLDLLMLQIYEDLGALPYNAEDVACDMIRWLENYVRPGHDYDHVDRDKVWSSCKINDHPYGRQRAMLRLGLVTTFNSLNQHPTGDIVISKHGLNEESYKNLVRGLK